MNKENRSRWLNYLPPLLLVVMVLSMLPVNAATTKVDPAQGESASTIPAKSEMATSSPTSEGGNFTWDWNGIIGIGQSLSVGAQANPAITTIQPYGNLKLALNDLTVPPWNYNAKELKMVPLVEPIRNYASGYPGPYPGNIYGETPHTAMANQISSLVKSAFEKDYITTHTVAGESGQGMTVIQKGAEDTGSTGRAYAAALFEVQAIKRLAAAAGKTFGVTAITLVHGETDAGNTGYESQMRQMWSDYNADIKGITGQSQKVIMLTNQQHSYPDGGISASTLAEWRIGVDYPEDMVCCGPKYQYPYFIDGVHLVARGYQLMGEKMGEVYYEKVVRGNNWQPLQPTRVTRTSSTVITVNFHVPVPPLVWATNLTAPNQNTLKEWKNGKGFEVYTTDGSRITIDSVAISDNSIVITCSNDLPTSGLKVGYALTTAGTKRTNGTFRWGLLRDSDPFKGSVSGIAQPNYCVSFELAVP